MGPLQATHGRSESDIDFKIFKVQKESSLCCWRRGSKKQTKANRVEPLEAIS